MSYEGRIIKREADTHAVEAFAVSWDGDEYVSQGEIHPLSGSDFYDLVLAVVEDEPYAYAALGQFHVETNTCESALILGLEEVEQLIKQLPAIRDRLKAMR